MTKVIDYYFAPSSPWAHLGHRRLCDVAAAAGATIVPMPVDFGRIFPVSGGLPLKQRSAQRQAYRISELKRWRSYLNEPLNLAPRYFPVDADPSSLLLIATLPLGSDAVMRLAGALMRACWVEERNIADSNTLAAIADEQGLHAGALLDVARTAESTATYEAFTARAIAMQVFGAPTFVFQNELFWGQDRLEFLQRALAA